MRRSLAAGAAVLALALVACGDGEPLPVDTAAATTTAAAEVATTSPGPFPVTVEGDGGEITLEAPPARIAALSATHVEILYAIGAGDELIAVDNFSNFPAQAASLPKVDSFNLSVESVIALDPDLVILTFDPVDAVPALEAVGIPTLLFGTAGSLEAAYGQIGALGAATGRSGEAAALVADMQRQVDDIVAGVGGAGAGVTYYHETDPFSFYTPNSESFIGKLYGLLGMENIADAAPDEFGSGFPQLSPEFIIDADPQMIFLASAGETVETLSMRNGWESMSAITTGRVVTLDPDVSSRWGPRIVDLLGAIAEALTAP